MSEVFVIVPADDRSRGGRFEQNSLRPRVEEDPEATTLQVLNTLRTAAQSASDEPCWSWGSGGQGRRHACGRQCESCRERAPGRRCARRRQAVEQRRCRTIRDETGGRECRVGGDSRSDSGSKNAGMKKLRDVHERISREGPPPCHLAAHGRELERAACPRPARCLGRVFGPTSKNEDHESESASGEEAPGRKRRNRRPARALTCMSYVWAVVRWKMGGWCRRGDSTEQFSAKRGDIAGSSAAASGFSAMREEGKRRQEERDGR
ncbi:hypothetical protein B0H13DRAFT_2561418 [Mycena leptocephala]|nr:hypothetical protein B0H13DRAFT_2561418 [Mycena leptocephala]